MARVKFTAIVDQISGKLNGTVFSKNRAGAYVRSKGRFKAGTELVTKVNLGLNDTKARFGSLASQWSGLSQYEREAFINAVPDWATTNIFGDLKNPSGFNLFMKLNMVALGFGSTNVAAITTPPTKIEMASMSFWQSDVMNGVDPGTSNLMALQLTLSGDFVLPANQVLVIEATRPLSAGVTYVGNSDYRQVLQIDSTVLTGNIDILDQYSAVFGAGRIAGDLPVGQRVFFKAYFVSPSTGQKGVASVRSSVIGQA